MTNDQVFTSYSVDNDRKFRTKLSEVLEKSGTLRTPFNLIRNDFYKSEKAIFRLKGPGEYPDFGGFRPFKFVKYHGASMTVMQRSRLKKEEKYGFAYPLLKATGKLEASVTSPSAEGSLNDIKDTYMIIGSTIPYFKYHQSDLQPRKRVPLRKLLFIGAEGNVQAVGDIPGRLTRWLGYLDQYYKAYFKKIGEVN